eukprot:CAMPEP_0182424346 /NCGR_PEP_ID=MMETSP1167-20130531/10548_1 /TAXON_ID=2988 /ORGANISM="Mallomonas Sp, Strain CCMP3275" /LENGTH=297 /DNA_ID=CAMNT_0024604095 /DNA_START=290 /DNA_END=1183 /DNA_ORIENTATION=+
MNQTIRMKTFPRYLVIKLGRYYIDETWVQRKVNVSVIMPDILDLREYKGTGIKDGEVPIPEEDEIKENERERERENNTSSHIQPDEILVSQLIDMGFSLPACQKAAIHTGNSSVDEAMSWILEHMEDPDFNAPVSEPASVSVGVGSQSGSGEEGGEGGILVDPEIVSMLSMSLGYTEKQVQKALKETGNDVERAADWLFSHPDELDDKTPSGPEVASSLSLSLSPCPSTEDGEGIYSLASVISHLGKSADHGHYVCHIRKHGQWILYNDDKVAASENVSNELGFLYFYKRIDGSGEL